MKDVSVRICQSERCCDIYTRAKWGDFVYADDRESDVKSSNGIYDVIETWGMNNNSRQITRMFSRRKHSQPNIEYNTQQTNRRPEMRGRELPMRKLRGLGPIMWSELILCSFCRIRMRLDLVKFYVSPGGVQMGFANVLAFSKKILNVSSGATFKGA